MSCPYCQRQIRVESKRIGLKEHIRTEHPTQYNIAVKRTAETMATKMTVSSIMADLNLKVTPLVGNPVCPCCHQFVNESDSNSYGLHVLRCSNQVGLLGTNLTVETLSATVYGSSEYKKELEKKKAESMPRRGRGYGCVSPRSPIPQNYVQFPDSPSYLDDEDS